mmetsp:Transcript_110231/g.318603  ORF Transcript_110231/g.318603 Transcript_110231/m.318603 type:complete len:211 (-) Transcript_110231:285-917(-)
MPPSCIGGRKRFGGTATACIKNTLGPWTAKTSSQSSGIAVQVRSTCALTSAGCMYLSRGVFEMLESSSSANISLSEEVERRPLLELERAGKISTPSASFILFDVAERGAWKILLLESCLILGEKAPQCGQFFAALQLEMTSFTRLRWKASSKDDSLEIIVSPMIDSETSLSRASTAKTAEWIEAPAFSSFPRVDVFIAAASLSSSPVASE